MTSTSFTTGFGAENKPSSKVLRPPGGGTSDIFGSDTPISTPRSARNHMQSNIFGSTQDAHVKNSGDSGRGQKNIDSHNRLFGESERPFTPAKNHLKSNIPIGGEKSTTQATNGNGTSSAATPSTNGHAKNGKIENGNGNVEHQNGISKTDGNPVTGEGYNRSGGTVGAGEINKTVPSLNGANQVINKNRIPPGGFSSGLW